MTDHRSTLNSINSPLLVDILWFYSLVHAFYLYFQAWLRPPRLVARGGSGGADGHVLQVFSPFHLNLLIIFFLIDCWFLLRSSWWTLFDLCVQGAWKAYASCGALTVLSGAELCPGRLCQYFHQIISMPIAQVSWLNIFIRSYLCLNMLAKMFNRMARNAV